MRKSVRMRAWKPGCGGGGGVGGGGGRQRTHALQVTKRGRVSGSNAPWNLRVRDDIRRWAHLPPATSSPLSSSSIYLHPPSVPRARI